MTSMAFLLQFCRARGQLAALALALVFGPALAANAQSSATNVPNAMQGFAQNRDQPIQIEAASLEMRDKKKEATFAGNVKVVQGDTTMTSKTLVVFYESSGQGQGQAQGQAQGQQPAPAKGTKTAAAAPGAPMQSATPGPGGSSSIKRLEARGNVVVTQKDQVVTGETAVFDTKANLITMVGGVVLTQCKNVLEGDRLFVDMTTGVSRVEADSGKVRGLFINEGGCAGQAPGQPPSTAPSSGSKPGTGSPPPILNQNKPK
jgi:lipopolysaccharide export system protein LptA